MILLLLTTKGSKENGKVSKAELVVPKKWVVKLLPELHIGVVKFILKIGVAVIINVLLAND